MNYVGQSRICLLHRRAWPPSAGPELPICNEHIVQAPNRDNRAWHEPISCSVIEIIIPFGRRGARRQSLPSNSLHRAHDIVALASPSVRDDLDSGFSRPKVSLLAQLACQGAWSKRPQCAFTRRGRCLIDPIQPLIHAYPASGNDCHTPPTQQCIILLRVDAAAAFLIRAQRY